MNKQRNMNKEMESRLDRLDTMIREGRIIRGAWTDGHERACLLAALAPETGLDKSAHACPAEVMPQWLAHLTPWLDDAPSEDVWPELVRRYAALARRWHVLNTDDWEHARIGALISILREARQHVLNEAVTLTAIDEVLAWLHLGAPASLRSAAHEAAVSAAVAAEKAVAAAEWSAVAPAVATAWSARAAAKAAVAAATAVATAVAMAAAAAAWSARSSRAGSRYAVRDAASDRIATAVLDAIEREIVAAGGAVR